MDKALIYEAVVFVANDESAEGADPRDRAFDLPTSAVAAELPSVLRLGANSSSAVRTDQVPTLGRQVRAELIAVISSIGDQRRRLFADGD